MLRSRSMRLEWLIQGSDVDQCAPLISAADPHYLYLFICKPRPMVTVDGIDLI